MGQYKLFQYKLLALDLDGTLTNSEKKISEKNKKYIKKAQEKGVSIILASGRPVLGIQKIADELNLKQMGGYILAYNGGQIIDCKTGKDLIRQMVPQKYYADICSVNRFFQVYPLTYNKNGVICEDDESPYVKKEAFNNSIPIIKVDSLIDYVKEPVVKFMVVGEPKELDRAYRYMKEKFAGKLNIFFSEPYFLEVAPPNIEKSSALKKLLEILNIKRNELMACGDGLNDIPMLDFAGWAVAMENAYPETKLHADYISASNDDDGVAEAIEKFII